MAKFDITAVIDHFRSCLHDEEDIKVIDYVRAYEELSRLFNELGVIFSFVESDVSSKRDILSELHSKDPSIYGTVLSMVDSEHKDPQNPQGQGSRTFLRLHRALAFLIKFVEDVYNNSDDHVAARFRFCYQETLAPHHTWIIRKTVEFASKMVPSRGTLIEVIFHANSDPDHVDKSATDFLEITQTVYKRVQTIYETRDLLNLP